MQMIFKIKRIINYITHTLLNLPNKQQKKQEKRLSNVENTIRLLVLA